MGKDQERIKQMAREMKPRLIAWRRHLHMNPELSEQEYKTSEYIQEALDSLGIAFRTGIAGTGIVGLIEGQDPGSACIALRADMDALPIHEQNPAEYASKNPGVMHACGHDAHMASLLGTASILVDLKSEFSGTVKLIFQPSEEKYPGGAVRMIREGVLEDPSPDIVYGQHVLPTLDAGQVGFREGRFMASTDEIHITVKGKGGHGATPELVTDPVAIAAQILVSLQQLVSRKSSPTMPTVLSFGRVIADGQTNIIPDEVEMHGILRTFDEVWREEAKKHITGMANGIAASLGAECDVFIDPGYPFLVNDGETTRKAMEWSSAYLGQDRVTYLDQRMTAEDFAYFSHARPSCFYRLGVRNEPRGIDANLHTSIFDIDEEALVTGAGLMAWIAVETLEHLRSKKG